MKMLMIHKGKNPSVLKIIGRKTLAAENDTKNVLKHGDTNWPAVDRSLGCLILKLSDDYNSNREIHYLSSHFLGICFSTKVRF